MAEKRQGKITVITGPMFSGKTSMLITLLEREMIAGRKVALFKPKIDVRYGDKAVITHKGMNLPAVPVSTDVEGIRFIEENSGNSDVIGIDEAQFWDGSSTLPATLDRLAHGGKTIYVSMLNRDHQGYPFGSAVQLLAMAEYVHCLTAICLKCGNEATFTQRVVDGKEVFGERVQIGGKDSYEPRCRACYVRPPK